MTVEELLTPPRIDLEVMRNRLVSLGSLLYARHGDVDPYSPATCSMEAYEFGLVDRAADGDSEARTSIRSGGLSSPLVAEYYALVFDLRL